QLAVSVTLRQIGCGMQLLRRNASAQDGAAHVKQSRLLLRMDAHMVAKNVIRRLLRRSGLQPVAKLALNFLQERFGSPAVLEEEILQPCRLAVFAQHTGAAHELADAFATRNPM